MFAMKTAREHQQLVAFCVSLYSGVFQWKIPIFCLLSVELQLLLENYGTTFVIFYLVLG